ncbi:hypothetical protein OH77DRAFT_1428562 [Trametes cingulata]|nr:hypothetical protein OH77DRAFT_1428562 [Trametes cingulata]
MPISSKAASGRRGLALPTGPRSRDSYGTTPLQSPPSQPRSQPCALRDYKDRYEPTICKWSEGYPYDPRAQTTLDVTERLTGLLGGAESVVFTQRIISPPACSRILPRADSGGHGSSFHHRSSEHTVSPRTFDAHEQYGTWRSQCLRTSLRW